MKSEDRHLSRLATGGLLSVIGSGVSAVAGIALVATVTNGVSRELAGTLFATTSLWVIICAVTQLGTEVGLVRWLPTLLATGRRAEIPRVLCIALGPVLLASCVAAVALYLGAEVAAGYLVGDEQQADGALMLRCLAAFIPVYALHHSLLAATRGMGTMRTTVLVDLVGRSIAQPVAVLVIGLQGGAAALVLSWLAPFVVAAAATGFALRRQVIRALSGRVDLEPAEAPSLAGHSRGLGRDFWRFTGPRGVATLSQAALRRSDIVLIAALLSPADAAVYTAATRFMVLGQMVILAIQQTLGPQLSKLFAQQDTRTAESVFRAATAWTMLLTWPLYLVCAAAAPLILSLFGEGYDVEAGQRVMVILAGAMLIATASGSVDTVLLMAGRSWLSLLDNLGALVLNVGLNLVLIRPVGIEGAAISWAAAIAARNIVTVLQVRAMLGLSSGGSAARWVAVSAVACFGIPGLALRLAGASQPLLIGVEALVCAPAYLALVWWRRDTLHLPLLGRTLLTRLGRSKHSRPKVATH